MNNKFKLLTGLFLGCLSVTFVNFAQADTQVGDLSIQSNTFINVSAPTVENLYLTQAPDFNFSSLDASVSTALSVKGSSSYGMVNITGTGTGFHLQQTISNFTDTTDPTLILPIKYFKVTVADNVSGTVIGSSGINILGQAGTVLTGQANASGIQNSGDTSAELQLDTTKTIKPGDYQATITNTLVQGL